MLAAVKLHLLSDLHLSAAGLVVPDTGADLVLLAGDIARPAQAVAWATQLDRPVLYVPGNHEFYGGSLDGTVAELRALCAGTAVHLLHDEVRVLRGVRFLGSVLWTGFDQLARGQNRAQALHEAQGFSRDFSRIRWRADAPALFTPQQSAELFAGHRAWLAARLAEPFDGPTVVITHHAPSPRSIHARFAGSRLNAAFVADLEDLMGASRVALWVHGHTHDSFDYRVRGTRVVCNPRGYARDGAIENAAFDPGLVLSLDLSAA